MKFGKFYEEPKVFFLIVAFAIFLYTLNINQRAGIVLMGLGLLASIIHLYLGNKSRINVNSVKKNTVTSMGIALMMLGITIGATIIISGFLGYFSQGFNTGTIENYLSYAKKASIGSSVTPFEGTVLSPIITFVLFAFAFPVAETIIAIQLLELLFISFNQKMELRNPIVWGFAGIIGIIAIFYHIYAKTTEAGTPNINVLLVMFAIFFTEAIFAVITKEKEASIWHHIFNNTISVFGLITANPIIIILGLGSIVLFALLSSSTFNIRKLFST